MLRNRMGRTRNEELIALASRPKSWTHGTHDHFKVTYIYVYIVHMCMYTCKDLYASNFLRLPDIANGPRVPAFLVCSNRRRQAEKERAYFRKSKYIVCCRTGSSCNLAIVSVNVCWISHSLFAGRKNKKRIAKSYVPGIPSPCCRPSHNVPP